MHLGRSCAPWRRFWWVGMGLTVASLGVAAQTQVLINPGDQGEQSRYAVFNAWKGVIERALRDVGAGAPSVQFSTNATADLQTTRSKTQDVFVAPAHVVGSAVRYGYKPLVGVDRPVQVVLVAMAGSGIGQLEQAKGKRLGLPEQDSVVTYLVRGEVNAANTTIKRHFSSVLQTRYQDALLPCLQLRRCDVVAVEKPVYARWLAGGEKLTVVLETREVPGMSVALRDDSKINAGALRQALEQSLGTALAAVDGGKPVLHQADDFKYVSTLGYFTPRSLPGASVPDAAAVAQLLQRGARFIDTRTEAEFKAGHVPGAVLIPYNEKSPKDADYDGKLDQFDLSQLGSNKAAELVFACNGAECWKSYKASRAALAAGFTRVHWFRGGFPEWRASGQKIASGG